MLFWLSAAFHWLTGLVGLPAPAAPVAPPAVVRPIAAHPGRSLPPVLGPRNARRPLVVIDAGHGGHDPGSPAIDGRHREKEVALAIARAVRDALLATGRVRVALTRDDDRFLVLRDRREIARALDADLFVSIHADSSPRPDARGATIYTLSDISSDRAAAAFAARENRADIVNGVDLGRESSDVSSILIDLARRETMAASAAFAVRLQRALAPVVPFRSTTHKSAGFIVLKAPDVPSVLLETGYMSNREDAARLFSRDHQRAIADGAARAVEGYFARRLGGR